MLPEISHFPVNWVDGMKITRRNFTEFEYFVSDHLRDVKAMGLTSYNYGLLNSGLADFNPQVITDPNQNLRVLITNCRAVTGAGCRIEIISPPKPVELSTSLAAVLANFGMPMADELEFLIVLKIDVFSREPVGQPAPTEAFPRPPFTHPQYTLSIVPRHHHNSSARSAYRSHEFEAFHLIVGQISCKYGQLINNDNYIPACTTISSHYRLKTWADKTYKLLSEVQRDAFLIVRKVCEKRGSEDARKAGVLAELIRDLCEQLALALDEPLNNFNYTGYERAPVYLIEAITLATRKTRTALYNLNNFATTGSVKMGDQLVLKYFQDWTDISPERLTKQGFERIISYSYDHSDIHPQLELITQCWTDIAKILNELSKLDFIGQERKDIKIRYDSVVTAQENIPNRPGSNSADQSGPTTTRPRFTQK